MKPQAPYDPQHRPHVGSRLTIKPNKPGGREVPGILEGYLPGRVTGTAKGAGHRNILVRIEGVAVKTSTLRIGVITWYAPKPDYRQTAALRKRRTKALAEADHKARLPVQKPPDGIFEFADFNSAPRASILDLWSADREDENGDLPPGTPEHPGIELVRDMALRERLGKDVLRAFDEGRLSVVLKEPVRLYQPAAPRP